jgi:multidrug resistance efflux pump
MWRLTCEYFYTSRKIQELVGTSMDCERMNNMTESGMKINNENNMNMKISEPDDNHRKKRERIKTIMIVFLAILLVLTFFSNTIMNHSLPEIATQACVSGNLTEKLRVNGSVEANQAYNVTVTDSKTVDKVNIKNGQQVKKDDVLFTLTTVKSTELDEAQTQLDTMQLEYQKALLTVPKDFASENAAIKNAREDLQGLIAKRDSVAASEGATAYMKAQYNDSKSQLQLKTNELNKYQGYMSALDSNDFSTLPSQYADMLSDLKSRLETASAELEKAQKRLDSLSKSDTSSDGAIMSAQSDVTVAQSKYNTYSSTMESQKEAVRSALTQEMNSVQSEVDNLTADVAAKEAQMPTDSQSSSSELTDQITTKQRELENLMIALEQAKKENNATQKIGDITLQSQKDAIDRQQKKVDELKKNSGTTEIKSKYAGVVSAVNVKAGDAASTDTPLAVIDLADDGYTVKASVEANKLEKIKVGSDVEIVNDFSGKLKAKLSDIKSDEQKGSKYKVLIFELTGDVDSGQNLEFSIPCGSGEYDTIVPKNAVHEDKNGKFVLTVKSKSTPLGNRYTAERVSVEVESSDENSSAVSGGISTGDFVITTSSKPIKPDDQVRMKDKV